MSLEREQLRVNKTNLEFQIRKLKANIESLCTVIRSNLYPALNGVENMKVPEAVEQMDELVQLWTALQVALSDLGRVNGELL